MKKMFKTRAFLANLSNVVLMFLVLACISNVRAEGLMQEIQNRGYIRVSTNADFDPFEYKDGNRIIGIDVDIARKIANYMGLGIDINDVSFDAITLELKNRNCDFAIAAMSYSDEKAENVDFSDTYYRAKQAIIVPVDSNIKSGEDLHGKTIGVPLGFTGDIYCTENFPDSTIERYGKGSDAVLDLMNGRIDAVVIDDTPARKLVKLSKNKTVLLDDYLFEESYRIAVPKGESEFLENINTTLERLKSDGEIEKIVSKYVGVNETESVDLVAQFYKNLVYKNRYKMILSGLGATISITVVALIIGIVIGFTLSLVKVSKNKNICLTIFKFLSNCYITIIRGTPVVVQLFVIYYLVFASTGLPKILIAMIAFGINSGAYVAEVVRGGLLSVDSGQYEAGRSLGLSNRITMFKIIIPQAIKNVLPSLVGEFINLIKETAVAGFIGITDLSRAGDIIRSQTYEPFVPLVTVAVIYLIIVAVLTALFSVLERRMRSGDKR